MLQHYFRDHHVPFGGGGIFVVVVVFKGSPCCCCILQLNMLQYWPGDLLLSSKDNGVALF